MLSVEECAQVLAQASILPKDRAATEAGISKYRGGQVAWIARNDQSEWLYRRICEFAFEYAFDKSIAVDSIQDPLQFAEYPTGCAFDWHLDTGVAETKFRKVTVSIQLTSAHDYDGGDLEFVGEAKNILQRARGSGVAFGSCLGHRVTEITRGARCALVGWICGPPFR